MKITIKDIYEDSRFEKYYALLTEWNERFNLTAVTGREDVFEKHFLDSVAAAGNISSGAALLDVGSGAGFPGIPLKIVRPDIRVVLADSQNKRVEFLRAVIKELALEEIEVMHIRAEDLDKTIKYDVVTARAVAKLQTLAEYCLPFVRNGGTMIAYKASEIEQELKEAERAVKILGGRIKGIEGYEAAGAERKLVIIEKERETPQGYPRAGNLPRKKPL